MITPAFEFIPRFVYIMRGIPGSGKSTVAERLAIYAGLNGKIHSTDSYFLEGGVYKFDPTKLPEYHAKNLAAFKESLQNGLAVVICDNINTRHWQYEEYVKAAEEHGYIVAIVTMPHPTAEVAAARNKHNVPLEAIQRMLNSWEQ